MVLKNRNFITVDVLPKLFSGICQNIGSLFMEDARLNNKKVLTLYKKL
tara:strand:+ start:1312 stop:1455 length:144 start_codon:yes stop_codon:yes gene_type:complete